MQPRARDRAGERFLTEDAVGLKGGVSPVVEQRAGERGPDDKSLERRELLRILQLRGRSAQKLIGVGDLSTLEALQHALLALRVYDVGLRAAVRAVALHGVLPSGHVDHGVDNHRAVLVVAEPADSQDVPLLGHEGPKPIPQLDELRANLDIVLRDDNESIVALGDRADRGVMVVGAAGRAIVSLHVRLRRLAEALLAPIRVLVLRLEFRGADTFEPLPTERLVVPLPDAAQVLQLMLHVLPPLVIPRHVDVHELGDTRRLARVLAWPGPLPQLRDLVARRGAHGGADEHALDLPEAARDLRLHRPVSVSALLVPEPYDGTTQRRARGRSCARAAAPAFHQGTDHASCQGCNAQTFEGITQASRARLGCRGRTNGAQLQI
mmetsp:Transcript_123692/g.395754  ORF Transcript_123692/g.395754 Transcript_123692/m.395754 type:complete len:380 (+) Transcript_123692:1014-2153(+)